MKLDQLSQTLSLTIKTKQKFVFNFLVKTFCFFKWTDEKWSATALFHYQCTIMALVAFSQMLQTFYEYIFAAVDQLDWPSLILCFSSWCTHIAYTYKSP